MNSSKVISSTREDLLCIPKNGSEKIQSKILHAFIPRALVFIVHGAGEHCERYDWVAQRLVAEGYSAFALDHQGHGRSEGERHDVLQFDDYVDDVIQFVDLITAEYKDTPLFLMG